MRYRRSDSTAPIRLRQSLSEHGWSMSEKKTGAVSKSEVTGEISDFSEEGATLFFRYAVEHTKDATYWVRSDGSILYANKAARESLGYTHEEFVSMIVPDIDPDFPREAWPEHWREMKEAGTLTFEAHHQAKDGRIFPVEILSNFLEYEGEEYTWAHVRDITARKKAEVALRESQKLESIGLLAGGIAHDFNNLLVGVLGNASLALMDLPATSPIKERLEKIRDAARMASQLSVQMLAYAGKGKLKVTEVDISQAVTGMRSLLESTVADNAVLKFDLADGPPLIEADATQIRQIVLNLVTNASEALDRTAGNINVATGSMHCTQEYLSGTRLGEERPAGAYAYIDVSDTGSGMDGDTLDKMFDPFFTTKFIGRGLGLAALFGIVRGYEGAIKVESDPGQGTTIRVLLPALDVATHRVDDAEAAVPVLRHGATVLLVDDEPMVIDVTSIMLERAGLQVLAASSGQEAIDIFRNGGRKVDCVLLDLAMPGMNGDDVIKQLRKIDEDVPVILSSGHFQPRTEERLDADGLAGVIQKPYEWSTLAAVLGSVLGTEGAKA